MIYSKIEVLGNEYYVARDEVGYTFIGSPNGSLIELKRVFNDAIYVDSINFVDIEEELTKYLLGQSKKIGVPIHVIGTPFEKLVWNGLMDIKYGETLSYKELSKRIGKESSVRAVASAIGRNPLLFIIPCHRVIKSDGNLGGFRAGLDTKESLLKLEKQATTLRL